MLDDLPAVLEADGVAVLDRYLDVRTVLTLVDALDESGPPATSSAAPATLVRRGAVIARRNLLTLDAVRQFVAGEAVRVLIDALAPGHIAVRGIMFDKTGDANWTVPWHQDRSIAVATRHDVPGFGPWSTKAGVVHVQPPVGLLRSMITLRFSLDPCGPDNGPLRAVRGTHRSLLHPHEIDAVVESSDETLCSTDTGGVVIMRPLLLHASSPARRTTRRRVLHLEFGPATLPKPMDWAIA